MRVSSKDFAFKKGWYQVRQADVAACRKDLMDVLGLTTRAAFLQRMKGNVIPNMVQAKQIENVFAKYGIKQVWGE